MKNKKKHHINTFAAVDGVLLFVLSLICLLPIINVLAISFSSRAAADAGRVALWPVEFTTAAYRYVLDDQQFLKSLSVSVMRVLTGPALNLLLCILCAYPLSKSDNRFRARKVYVWIFLFCTLFNGGIIPTYMVVSKTGLINSFWSMIIPGAVPVMYVIMMMNFFRSLPPELEEAALIDGANQWQICWQVIVPLSKASIATITLFCIVNHWNSWFDGMLYFNTSTGQPLATYLHNLVVNSSLDVMKTGDVETIKTLSEISTQTTKAAQIFLAMLPILIVYPYMRRYFSKGIVMGSVKGLKENFMDAPQYKSIEYQFRDQRLYEDYYALFSIGWEYWASPEVYYRDCRTSAYKQCVFQYTVSGEGTLVYNQKAYAIKPGQAFLIERPGQYQYYRSPNAKHWELKFITLNISCLKIWSDLAERFGRVFDLPADSAVMRCWDEIYRAALNNEMGSFYTASGYAYQFMMQLYNTLIEQTKTQSMSDVVQRCMALIQTEYKNELDLAYLSKACNVSIPYLSKRFQEALHISPIQYLNQHRIEVASSLLLRSRNRIEEIAHEVGFSDANYFARVFKKTMGCTPRDYRLQEVRRVVEDHTLQVQVSPEGIIG